MGQTIDILASCAKLPRSGSFEERLQMLSAAKPGLDAGYGSLLLIAHDSQDDKLRQNCLSELCSTGGIFGKKVRGLLDSELRGYGLEPSPELLGGLSLLLSQSVFSEYRVIHLRLMDNLEDLGWFDKTLKDLAAEIALAYSCLAWQKRAILRFEELYQDSILLYLKRKYYYYYNTFGLKIREARSNQRELPEIYDFIIDGILYTGEVPDYDWLGRLLSPGWGGELPKHEYSYPSCRLASYDPRKNAISGFLLNIFSCRGFHDIFERILTLKFSYSFITSKKSDGTRARLLTAHDHLTFSFRQLNDTYDPGSDRLRVSTVDYVDKYKNNPFLKYQSQAAENPVSSFSSSPSEIYEVMIERKDMNRRFLDEVVRLLGSENCWLLENYYRFNFNSQKVSTAYKSEFKKSMRPETVRKRVQRSIEKIRGFAGKHPLWRDYFEA